MKKKFIFNNVVTDRELTIKQVKKPAGIYCLEVCFAENFEIPKDYERDFAVEVFRILFNKEKAQELQINYEELLIENVSESEIKTIVYFYFDNDIKVSKENLNEGTKRTLFTKKEITTLANEFAGNFKGFSFGEDGKALLLKEVLKEFFVESLKHDIYEESAEIKKPKLSIHIKSQKKDNNILYKFYEKRAGRDSDILKITLNTETKKWSIRRFDSEYRETAKSKIVKEYYNRGGVSHYGMSDDALNFVVAGDIYHEEEYDRERNKDIDYSNIQFTDELYEANGAYGNKIYSLLMSWVGNNLDKMTPMTKLLEKNLVSSNEFHHEDHTELYVDLMMRHRGGAVYLYFMEFRGEGVGTWDGDWDILFKDGKYTVEELRKYIKENSSEEAENLQTAIDNMIYDYREAQEKNEEFNLEESYNKIIKEWNGAARTDVVIYTARHIKAWIPTESDYAKDFARGWITVLAYNNKTGEDIRLEGNGDGQFTVDSGERGEQFDENTCAKYLSCDEETSNSMYETISDYDYNEFMVNLLDGTEEDPTTELSQEAIETAKQESIDSLENLIREYIVNYYTQNDMDNIVKDVLENIDTKLDWNDFEVEWDSMGNAYAEMIDFQKEEEPEVVEAIINALKKYNLLDPEAISEPELDLDESFNNIFNTYINEEYKWDNEADYEDLQYLIDEEAKRYNKENVQRKDDMEFPWDVFLRKCKLTIDNFAWEKGLDFYDILKDITGKYQMTIYFFLDGDVSHVLDSSEFKQEFDQYVKKNISDEYKALKKAIIRNINSEA